MLFVLIPQMLVCERLYYILHKICGNDVALKKLDEIEDRIRQLGENPDLGIDPRYLVLKRQGYKVLILEKDLVFYKVNEARKEVIIYAVVDQRQDYLNIIRGL